MNYRLLKLRLVGKVTKGLLPLLLEELLLLLLRDTCGHQQHRCNTKTKKGWVQQT